MLTVLLVFVLPAVYLCLRLARQRRLPVWLRALAIPCVFAIAQVYALDSCLLRHPGSELPDWLLSAQLFLYTALILLFLCVAGLDSFRLCRRILHRFVAQGTHSPSRRTFLRSGATLAAKSACLAAPPLALAIAGVGRTGETRLPGLHRMELFLPRLPPGLDGLTIAQLSDIHVGPLTRPEWVRAVVECTNAARPELVCLTGDLIDGRWDYPAAKIDRRIRALEELAGLRASRGVFACTGNHEYYGDYMGWMALYARLGIRVLHNEAALLARNGDRLVLIGVDDRTCRRIGKPRPHPAFLTAELPASDAHTLRLLLMHRAEHLERSAEAGVDVQLSGHTHGGQCRGMEWGVAATTGGLVRGWHLRHGLPVYVSTGIGVWSGLPVRLGIPAEIALITLKRGTGAEPRWHDC